MNLSMIVDCLKYFVHDCRSITLYFIGYILISLGRAAALIILKKYSC